jgi:hypothetical protein
VECAADSAAGSGCNTTVTTTYTPGSAKNAGPERLNVSPAATAAQKSAETRSAERFIKNTCVFPDVYVKVSFLA